MKIKLYKIGIIYRYLYFKRVGQMLFIFIIFVKIETDDRGTEFVTRELQIFVPRESKIDSRKFEK